MGLIKKIFGGIFGLIGAIFGSIGGLLGLGKKGEFYLELEEGSEPVAGTGTPEPVVSQEIAAAPPAPTPQASSKSRSQKSEKKLAVQSKETATKPAKPEPAPAPSAPVEPAITTFATDYLVNPQLNFSPRRRPGPSVAPFKQMARSMGRQSTSMG